MRTLLATNNGRWAQESYETASRDAGRRSRQLRKLGYKVAVGSMGPQVTPVGTVKLTMVTVAPGIHEDTFGIPAIEEIRFDA